MQKITPFMWFDTQAEEAINFYVDVFNGSPAKKAESKVITLQKYPDGPLDGPWKGLEGKVLTGVFELEGQRFMGLDGGPYFKPTGAISYLIECETQEEVDYFWDKLSEGGAPEAQQCGWLADKFGFTWQVNPTALGKLLSDPDKTKSGRVMQAMMKMKKIIIADLQAAYDAE